MKSRSEQYRGESLLSYFHSKFSETSISFNGGATSNLKIDTHGSKSIRVRPVKQKASDPPAFQKYTKSKPCPFYKWIPDTPLTVDAFNYGVIKGCEAYILSHFHSDHYNGLSASFPGTIYCSAVRRLNNFLSTQVTKSLVRIKFGGNLKVVAIPLNESFPICGIDVVAMDANHCPGSVMFLFHLKSMKRFILHTGDFRFHLDMLLPPSPLADIVGMHLIPVSGKAIPQLHTVYLDTTYCSSQYDFPPQQVIIAGAVEVTRVQLEKYPNTVVVCGMYTLGKERFVYGLASELNLRVWLHRNQHQLVSTAALNGCTVCASLMAHVVSNQQRAQLHVLPMAQLGMSSLIQYRTTLGPSNDQTPFNSPSNVNRPRPLVAWRPTGWSHQTGAKTNKLLQTTLDSSKPLPEGIRLQQCNDNIRIYGAAYSEHSSYSELKRFITHLRPNHVQPTVFGSAARGCQLEIESWLENHSPTDL
ncbi:hypothetical protein T265_07016 [Opisthorchis viverrini]|uniref:DNA repair metallo-beta-lactamase domain-containing protein n=1 Tax=Opisthorchis viverrini TaxID=6198 RepID=A0A074ZID3_OPIVI|nr:hypothetical protein T265_07016 [Opisthorchis viverrini]KER25557.1 hypothetical protein T265_07016 [Opisthorchis viverrini]